ncbi:PSTK kinase, partial [Polypterus senegalus]
MLNKTPHALCSPIEDDVIWKRFMCCLKHEDGQSPSASINSEILPDSLCMQFLRAPLVVLDDNFYYPSMRYEVFQLARKCNQASSRNLRSLAEQLHKLKESLLDDLRHGHLRGRGVNLRSMDEVVIEATDMFERETMNIVSRD